MDVKKLSNKELYWLVMDKSVSEENKAAPRQEFKQRNLDFKQLDELALEYDLNHRNETQKELSIQQKVLIVFSAFFLPLQAIIAYRLLRKGESKKWKQYWQYLQYGYLIWTVVIIIFGIYYFRDR